METETQQQETDLDINDAIRVVQWYHDRQKLREAMEARTRILDRLDQVAKMKGGR